MMFTQVVQFVMEFQFYVFLKLFQFCSFQFSLFLSLQNHQNVGACSVAKNWCGLDHLRVKFHQVSCSTRCFCWLKWFFVRPLTVALLYTAMKQMFYQTRQHFTHLHHESATRWKLSFATHIFAVIFSFFFFWVRQWREKLFRICHTRRSWLLGVLKAFFSHMCWDKHQTPSTHLLIIKNLFVKHEKSIKKLHKGIPARTKNSVVMWNYGTFGSWKKGWRWVKISECENTYSVDNSSPNGNGN